MENEVYSQRDFIRLTSMLSSNPEFICMAYAVGENSGLVQRKSNRYGIDSYEYGRRLLGDRQRKGW